MKNEFDFGRWNLYGVEGRGVLNFGVESAKWNAPYVIMEINIAVYILKQVDAGGRQQRPKIPERC